MWKIGTIALNEEGEVPYQVMIHPLPEASSQQNVISEPVAIRNGIRQVMDNYVHYILLVLYAILFLRAFWVGDDAYITLRVIDNFAHGDGLRWNIDERVQVYTHPFWLLLLVLINTLLGSPYQSVVLLSSVCSLGAAWMLLRSGTFWSKILLFITMIFSQSLVDYSSSGLENPLVHLLLLTMLFYHMKEKSQFTDWLYIGAASLLLITRHDMIIFVLPLLLTARMQRYLVSVAFVPLSVWTLFSIIYYGFPFPNTAYAKMGHGIPRNEVISQGVSYFQDWMGRDPVSAFMVLIGIMCWVINGGKKGVPVVAGIVAYGLYIIAIGGDFMAGRFFSIIIISSVYSLSLLKKEVFPKKSSLFINGIILLGLVISISQSMRIPLWALPANWSDYRINSKGIADEAGHFFYDTSLRNNWSFSPPRFPHNQWRIQGDAAKKDALENKMRVSVQGSIGLYGYFGGRRIHVVDRNALSDPLLSRLPAMRYGTWRIGHFERAIPEGYLSSLHYKENRITDPAIAELYSKISLITRSRQLFSFERWQVIWEVNNKNVPLQVGRMQDPWRSEIRISELPFITPDSERVPRYWSELTYGIIEPGKKLRIDLERTCNETCIDFLLSCLDHYTIILLKDGIPLYGTETGYDPGHYLAWLNFQIPPHVSEKGFTHIEVESKPVLGGSSVATVLFCEK